MNEHTLTEATTFGFGDALANLKMGRRVYRTGWNGRQSPKKDGKDEGMYLTLVPGSTFLPSRSPWVKIYSQGQKLTYHAHIDMMTAQGYVVPWVASQTDLLAEDWVCV